MKHFYLAMGLVIGLGLGGAQVRADGDEGTGFGVMVGEPTGISLKHWLDARSAFDLAAAWSLGEDDRFQLHADYLFHDFNLLPRQNANLRTPLYYGLGGRVHFKEDDTTAGIRIPVGLAFIFTGKPLDLFVELAPVLNVVPDTDLDMTGGLGIRYFFN